MSYRIVDIYKLMNKDILLTDIKFNAVVDKFSSSAGFTKPDNNAEIHDVSVVDSG